MCTADLLLKLILSCWVSDSIIYLALCVLQGKKRYVQGNPGTLTDVVIISF